VILTRKLKKLKVERSRLEECRAGVNLVLSDISQKRQEIVTDITNNGFNPKNRIQFREINKRFSKQMALRRMYNGATNRANEEIDLLLDKLVPFQQNIHKKREK